MLILLLFLIGSAIFSLIAIGFFYLRRKLYFVGFFTFLLFSLILLLSFWPRIESLFPYTYNELGGQALQKQAYEGINQIRVITKRRWHITSAYRSRQKNKAVGGASKSQHINGLAFDVKVPFYKREEFYKAARKAGFTAFGWGRYVVHIDMGPKRWWAYNNEGSPAKDKYQFLDRVPYSFKEDWNIEP